MADYAAMAASLGDRVSAAGAIGLLESNSGAGAADIFLELWF